MIRMSRLAAVALVAASLLSFVPQEAAEVKIGELNLKDPEFDDLSHLLRVQKTSGRYALKGRIRQVGLVFEVHKKGAKKAELIRSPKVSSETAGDRQGQFSIQIADLDYLKLGAEAKKTSRVLFAFNEGGVTIAGHSDVPKTLFDFSEVRGSGLFKPEVLDKRRIPLFWKAGGADGPIAFGARPGKVIEGNPELDVLIAYLECDLE